ncbi:adenylate/guanylate cyclase domain-containing protein [Nocardioides baekrokdamisoli]|uniref:adenylate/guanylate cyclase domain-containing protein n=1 Tax=Nocardioides baekrokdamisoli TaxID=1804624 RepID=UPI000F789873|nr:adenylate/guanylate cyclase domain-containing protein [Nocardioides baekrokdamisoli]
MTPPPTQYALAGEVSIAYKVVGDGPIDIVLVPGYLGHVELIWDVPSVVHMFERLGTFARVIQYDRRGTGLSDRLPRASTLEERVEDIRAVMQAVGSTSATLVGISEGAPTAILMATTHPDMVDNLVLYGGLARGTWAEDHPWAAPREDLLESSRATAPFLFEGAMAEVMAPSVADIDFARDFYARLQRYSASPSSLQQAFEAFLDIDVRALLPSVSQPTLVVHRRGDRAVNWRAGKYLADHIPGATYKELPGIDHAIYVGDADAVIDEIEHFMTGARRAVEVDRIVTTVMFVDIVGSTRTAAALGDSTWHDLLTAVTSVLRDQLRTHRGTEVKTLGDGLMATFDGPARSIRCAKAMIEATAPLGIELTVGLHTGEVEVTQDDDIAGLAVHLAARIGSAAQAGEILVSRTVRDLVAGSAIDFTDRGDHDFKGIPEPWRVYAVTS